MEKDKPFHPAGRNEDDLSFYIASSNEDMLRRVDRIMSEKGLVGVTDMNGRIHYMVDGRRGAQFAIRRIEDFSRGLVSDSGQDAKARARKVETYVDGVLRCYLFQRTLRGFIFLRHMMILLTHDQSLRSPVSKTLYPATAMAFRINSAKVERNLRYCLDQLIESERAAFKEECLEQQVFCEAARGIGRKKQRILIPGKAKYSNCEAIFALNEQIQAVIRKDNKEVVYSSQESFFND